MNENRNLLTAVLLCAAVIFGWQYFVAAPQMKAEKAHQAAISHQEKKAPEPGLKPNAPGISAPQLDSERTVFASRGFFINDLQYDGISSYYKSNYAAGESELDAIIYDRIEIVRGATGLLTGAGEPSASVNLVRKRADSKEFRGEAQVSAGSWDNYRSTLDLSGPLTPTGNVRGRLVGAYQDKKNFFDRYSREGHVIYGVVDVDLTDATTLSLGASYQKSDADGLTYLIADLNLGYRARTERELAIMADLVPLLRKRSGSRDISGLSAYEG